MRIINCASSCRIVSSATPTMINRLKLLSWRARTSVAAVTNHGLMATPPRKRAPPTVILTITRFRYSCVGLPGRMPGMKPPFR